ncbi:MAG: class I SAM-dependent RNA methyltransferase [Proteobacteria bacterium]|nr:class I SAM-dependent RNA methyltransferase [Pseudomonadota bacterium]
MSRKLPCPIQRECRICPHVNASYEKTLEEKSRRDLKQLELAGLLKNTRIQRTIASPRKLGFRTIFKLAVRKNPDSQSIDRFRLGLFRPGSHQIGPNLVSCPLHVSSLRALLKTLHPILEASSLNPYDEASHHGDLRYLIGRTNQEGNQLMLTWVVTRNVEEEIRRLIQELSRKGISVDVQAMNIHPDRDNSIWGKETRLISDQKYIEENLVGNHLELGPMSFFQVNPWQAENIYQRIDRIAQNQKEKKVAWDVFSGVGPISL